MHLMLLNTGLLPGLLCKVSPKARLLTTKTMRVMKLAAIILFATCLQVSARSTGQIVTLSVKNVPVKEVFRQIQKQTGLNVLVNEKLLNKAGDITIEVNRMPVLEVLGLCFRNENLTYTIVDGTIVVKPNSTVEVPSLLETISSIDVDAVVLDEKKLPLSGVSVRVKKGSKATSTNNNGYFSLKGIADDAVLVLSYIGYKTKEVKAALHLTTIQLELGTSALDEVQVQGYSKTSRRLSTTSVTVIKAEDIAKQPVDNPLYALQGRVPGLIITPTSGMPGSPVKLQIRGQNSLLGAVSEPLVVVDGVPQTNTMPGVNSTRFNTESNANKLSTTYFINPSEIESMTILKDADATSIYGSLGANGVILITTKRAKAGRTSLNVNLSTGYSDVAKFIKMMDTEQYLDMRKRAFTDDGLPVPTDPEPGNYDLTLWDQTRNTNWQKVLLGKKALSNFATVSLTGGSDLVQYMVSGLYGNSGYVFAGDAKSTRASGDMSLTLNSPNKKFTAVLYANYLTNKNVYPSDYTAAAVTLAPNSPALYTSEGALNWEPYLNPNSNLNIGTWQNPLADLSIRQSSNAVSLRGNVNLSYKLLRQVKLILNTGVSEIKTDNYRAVPISSMDPGTISANRGTADFSTSYSHSFLVEPQIAYNAHFSKATLDFLIGGSLSSNTSGSQTVTGTGYTDDLWLKSIRQAASFSVDNNSSESKTVAAFSRLQLNWNDTYIFTLSGRRDGSSNFGPGRRFGNFGSVGGAVLFSNYEFIKNALPFLSSGKLRGSYGNSGNNAGGNSAFLELFSSIRTGSFSPITAYYQGIPVIASGGAINPLYHWENVRKLGGGIELGFFDDRILLTADYFRTRCNDQLMQVVVASTVGALGNRITLNLPAEIQNMGGEFTLNTINIKTKNFRWATSANLSFTRNKLLKLPAGDTYLGLIPSYAFYNAKGESPIGKPFSGFAYGYEFRGVDPATGVYKFADQNGNDIVGTEKIDPNTGEYFYADITAKIVSLVPKYGGGISNQFTYKGLSLDIFLQVVKQIGRNPLYDAAYELPGYGGKIQNLPVYFADNWRAPGDISNLQRMSSQGYFIDTDGNFVDLFSSLQAIQQSDASYVDASFVRLKTVALYYALPENWIKKAGFRQLSIGLSAQNLYTFTKYKGPDPETQSVSNLPPLRSFQLSLSLGL